MSTANPLVFKAIVAVAENRAIGYQGKIPWHLPDDLRFFKQTTLGHIVLMGRRTFESIGRPLPRRENWVLSRSGKPLKGARVFRSIEELPSNDPANRTVFVIGGAAVYEALVQRCTDLFVTHVPLNPVADTFLPPIENRFPASEILLTTPHFTIRRYFFPSPQKS